MKKLAIFFLIIASIVQQSIAQNREIDSLLILLKTDKEDANKVNHLNKLCIDYRNIGNFTDGFDYGKQALALAQKINFKKGIAQSYNGIGLIYQYQGNYPEALKMHYEALKIREEIKDKNGIAACFINLGVLYRNQNNYTEALKNYLASLKIFQEIKNTHGISNAYNNIGVIYTYQRNYAEALKNYLASLNISEEIKDEEGIATCYINIGGLNTKINKAEEAGKYLNKALQLSKKIGSKEDIKESYLNLAALDSLTSNYKAAFEHYKLFIIYRDSLNNEETQKKSLQASMQYEFDKKEIAAKAAQEKLNAVTREEKEKQTIIIYSVAGVLLLVIIFSLFLFNRVRITQRQKKVIEEQKVLVDKAYEELHEKNKEVMDSIHYAKRIQNALITSEKNIQTSLNR